MKIIQCSILFLPVVMLLACSGEQPENPVDPGTIMNENPLTAPPTDTATQEPLSGQIVPVITVKDSSDYSTTFLEGLYELGYEKITLDKNMLILNDSDTAYFPEIPRAGKKFVLTGKKDHLAIALKVERINRSTISYELEMVETGKARINSKGEAHIAPTFVYGSEVDESSVSGLSYEAIEYRENVADCYTVIRLGQEEDSGPGLLGKLICNCCGDTAEITLDNFPTLIEK